MTDLDLTDDQVVRLTALAELLVPGTPATPAPSSLDAWEDLLRRAVRACGYDTALSRRALDAIDPAGGWDGVRAFADIDPEAFDAVAQLVTAAYYMAPAALKAIGYPLQHRFPPKDDEFANEFMTGILEPVMARGQRFRDSRHHGAGGPA